MAKLNPTFSAIHVDGSYENAASVKGVASKTLLLLGIAVISGFLSIMYYDVLLSNPIIYIGIVLGAILCGILGQTRPAIAKGCAIVYSICEGAMLGLISFVFESYLQGIVLTAVLVTVTIFCVMLFLYLTNVLRASAKFTKMLFVVGISIFALSLIYLIGYLIDSNNILVRTLESNPSLLILVSGLLILYGAFTLILDFEQVKTMINGGFDKRYEWLASLGLMVTLIWIYVEVLRLLAIIADRD